ncbi:MAG: hypothetical protein U5L11_16455 [Arhodomonas sp.]|nr:hypothetical protein [Arhodomonas sp.]
MMSEKQAARLLERLVTGLEAAFRIDANDYRLVGALGAGTERSNHDALHAWVWREIAGGYAEEPFGDQLLPKLGQRLERRLRQWEVDQWR